MKRVYRWVELYPLFTGLFILLAGLTQPSLLWAEKAAAYQVVPDWPRLPEGIALGVTGEEVKLSKGVWVAGVGGVGVNSHNDVYVFHRSNPPILCIDSQSGKLLKSWGEDLLINAHGLEVDHEDNIWVTDTALHQVLKFDSDGRLLLSVGEKGVRGLDATHFNQPTDIAIAPNGEFYVSDGYGNNRIAKFSAEGKFLFDWGTKGDQPGQFNLPHGIARDREGRIYVADRTNGRIQVFDDTGQFIEQWKSAELGRPWAIEYGDDGFLYVVDGGDLKPSPLKPIHPDRQVVTKLNTSGKIISKWGSFGGKQGQLDLAHDVAVGPDGAVYIGEALNQIRVQKFLSTTD